MFASLACMKIQVEALAVPYRTVWRDGDRLYTYRVLGLPSVLSAMTGNPFGDVVDRYEHVIERCPVDELGRPAPGWDAPLRDWVYCETRESAARLIYICVVEAMKVPDKC